MPVWWEILGKRFYWEKEVLVHRVKWSRAWEANCCSLSLGVKALIQECIYWTASSCISALFFQRMNPPCCKAGSSNWAELLPTPWLPLALSTHISYIITSVPCRQPLSLLCMCVGGPVQFTQASLISRAVCLHTVIHRGPLQGPSSRTDGFLSSPLCHISILPLDQFLQLLLYCCCRHSTGILHPAFLATTQSI